MADETSKDSEGHVLEKTGNFIEKSFFATLGAGMIIYEAASDVAKDLIERGKMAPEQGKEFLDGLTSRVDEQKKEVQKRMGDSTKATAASLGLATLEDIERINFTLEQISNRLALLEAKETTKHTHPPTTEI
jgi:polyhydroxyalkanoate synthesis regulator phasin